MLFHQVVYRSAEQLDTVLQEHLIEVEAAVAQECSTQSDGGLYLQGVGALQQLFAKTCRA